MAQLVDPYRQPYGLLAAGDPRTFADLLNKAGMAEVATYADDIGPWKPYLVSTVADGIERDGRPGLTINHRPVVGSTGMIEAAHDAGLFVHTRTFRNDASSYGFADPLAEADHHGRLGVDGVFTDFTDTGVAARASIPEPHALVVAQAVLVAAGAGPVWRCRPPHG